MGFMRIFRFSRVVIFFCLAVFAAAPVGLANYDTGMEPVFLSKRPFFRDDLSRDSLRSAISHSLSYLDRVPPERTFTICGRDFSAAWLGETLRSFLEVVNTAGSADELDALVRRQFDIFQARGLSGNGDVMVTGYFEPVLDGSLQKEPPFIYPLYRVPPDLAVMVGGSTFSGRKIGRLDGGKLVPYWSRAEIEEHDLLAGRELVYLRDPVDAFILHVQGSGKVRLRDGSIRRVQFRAKNGRPYSSIGRLLVDEGIMPLSEVSLPAIVQYLQNNPAARDRILRHNQSYIFFRWGDDGAEGPQGCLGEALTSGRSIALDQSFFPAGALCFLRSSAPVFDGSGAVRAWKPMSRFVLNQDAGSAIKGPGRVDLFWGAGPTARAAAGLMKHPGKLYFLIKKK